MLSRVRRSVAAARAKVQGSRRVGRVRHHLSRVLRRQKAPTSTRPAQPTAGADALFVRFASLLPRRDLRTVVVLGGPEKDTRLRAVLIGLEPTDRVLVLAGELDPCWELDSFGATFDVAATSSAVHARLKRLGPVDLLVDLTPGPVHRHEETWRLLFFHLRAGGAWVLPTRALTEGRDAGLTAFAHVARLVSTERKSWASDPDADLANACSLVALTPSATVAVMKIRHLLKVRETDKQVFKERNPRTRLSVLERLEPTAFHSEVTTITHESDVAVTALPAEFSVPALESRYYEGRIAVTANSLTYVGPSVLPESFRYPFEHSLHNPKLISVSKDFGRLDRYSHPKTQLRGNYFHADASYSGHFGHILTEVVSRLWAWDEAKKAIPDLKIIFNVSKASNREPVLERGLFTAYGIDPSDVVVKHEPVWVDGLVGATPMWHNQNPHFVHPQIAERIWSRMTDSLSAGRPGQGPKLFVSRKSGVKHRPCRNADAVEALFAQHGYVVVYPEDYDLPEQAAMFRDAEVVAGFGGSALFNVMHSQRLRHLIVLSHESYTARNEQLYSAVLGNTVEYFWSPADLKHGNHWTDEAFKSAWEFDFERNGEALRALLADLG